MPTPFLLEPLFHRCSWPLLIGISMRVAIPSLYPAPGHVITHIEVVSRALPKQETETLMTQLRQVVSPRDRGSL